MLLLYGISVLMSSNPEIFLHPIFIEWPFVHLYLLNLYTQYFIFILKLFFPIDYFVRLTYHRG